MSETQIFDILRDAFMVSMYMAAPALGTAIVVGLAIALLQALTQIQEMTLTFVPKIIAIMVVSILALPMTFGMLAAFTDRIIAVIVSM